MKILKYFDNIFKVFFLLLIIYGSIGLIVFFYSYNDLNIYEVLINVVLMMVFNPTRFLQTGNKWDFPWVIFHILYSTLFMIAGIVMLYWTNNVRRRIR